MGAPQRLVPRRHSEHHRRLHDADGDRVLDGVGQVAGGRLVAIFWLCDRGGPGHCPAHAAAVDFVAACVAALAGGVLSQRRTQPGSAAVLAVSGFFLRSDWARQREGAVFAGAAAAGATLVEGARWLDARPWQLYSRYDFWHTSPNFFLIRLGLLLMLLAASYAWCRWGAGEW